MNGQATKRRILIATMGALLAPACAPFASISFAPSYTVTITPHFAIVPVGGSQQLTAVVSGAKDQSVKWTTSSTGDGTISLSSTGEARCLTLGTASAIAVSTVDSLSADTATVFCGSQADWLRPSSFDLAYVAASAPCQRLVGQIWITNTYSAAATYSFSTSAPLAVVDGGGFSLSATQTRRFNINFDCSAQSSFVATVKVSAIVAGTFEPKVQTLTVTGTVSR